MPDVLIGRDFTDLSHVLEQILVLKWITTGAIEAFDNGILIRLSNLMTAMTIHPLFEYFNRDIQIVVLCTLALLDIL